MKKTLISLTIIVELLVWGYFLILTRRTEFWQKSTSIGNDVVVFMYLLCITACIISAIILIRTDVFGLWYCRSFYIALS